MAEQQFKNFVEQGFDYSVGQSKTNCRKKQAAKQRRRSDQHRFGLDPVSASLLLGPYNVCISCGVAWRGPGRRSGPVTGRPARSSYQLYPCQGRARPDRQLHASVIWPLPSGLSAIHLNHLQGSSVSNATNGGAAIPELRRTGPRLFSRSKLKKPLERTCSEAKETE